MTNIKKQADKKGTRLSNREETRPINRESKEPADRRESKPADIKGLIDIKMSTYAKDLIVIYYIY